MKDWINRKTNYTGRKKHTLEKNKNITLQGVQANKRLKGKLLSTREETTQYFQVSNNP